MSLSEKSETEKSGVEEEVSMFWGSEVGLSGAVVVVLDGGGRLPRGVVFRVFVCVNLVSWGLK